MKAKLMVAVSTIAAGTFASSGIAIADDGRDLKVNNPTVAKTVVRPRICQTQVLVPAVYQKRDEKVQVYEGATTYTTTAAQTSTGERKIKVADGYTDYEILPPVFKDVTEIVEIARERVEIETIPATYKTLNRQVKIREATQRWNPACGAVNDTTENSIPAHCLIKIPAEYQEVIQEIVDMPARTVKKIVPAQTKTITRKVLVEPAKIVVKNVYPQYTNVALNYISHSPVVMTSKQDSRYISIPAYQQLRPERLQTMAAWCEDNLQAENLQLVQQRLQQLGYYQGSLHGQLDTNTRTALLDFQESQGLATGALTLQTLQKLGIH